MVKVFIVEDDISLQFLYEQMLEFNGFEVVGIAGNGEEAVEMYKTFATKPDVVLMDHRMPLKNGIEATKEILQIDVNSKIIFTSADSSVKEEALSIGAIGFEEKPFTIEKLRIRIQQALNLQSMIKM